MRSSLTCSTQKDDPLDIGYGDRLIDLIFIVHLIRVQQVLQFTFNSSLAIETSEKCTHCTKFENKFISTFQKLLLLTWNAYFTIIIILVQNWDNIFKHLPKLRNTDTDHWTSNYAHIWWPTSHYAHIYLQLFDCSNTCDLDSIDNQKLPVILDIRSSLTFWM